MTEQGAGRLPEMVLPKESGNETNNDPATRLSGGADRADLDTRARTTADALGETEGQINATTTEQSAGERVAAAEPGGGGGDLVGEIGPPFSQPAPEIETGWQAAIRGRQPAPALDSGKRQAEPVQVEESLSIDNKGLEGDPVQAGTVQPANCPDFEGWRVTEGGLPLPKYFTAVPHLRISYRKLQPDGCTISTENLTGWQIQWGTTCSACQKRFRPVAGFISLRTILRMQELTSDDQRELIENIIRTRFESNSVNSRHSDCIG